MGLVFALRLPFLHKGVIARQYLYIHAALPLIEIRRTRKTRGQRTQLLDSVCYSKEGVFWIGSHLDYYYYFLFLILTISRGGEFASLSSAHAS